MPWFAFAESAASLASVAGRADARTTERSKMLASEAMTIQIEAASPLVTRWARSVRAAASGWATAGALGRAGTVGNARVKGRMATTGLDGAGEVSVPWSRRRRQSRAKSHSTVTSSFPTAPSAKASSPAPE